MSLHSLPTPTAGRYGNVAITCHWLTFALVVVVGTLGFLHDDWPKQTQSFWINIHAVLGLILWLLLLARIAWRLRHAPPPQSADTSQLARRSSITMHLLLYALLFIIPVLGIITFFYHGRILDLGLFLIESGINKNRAVFQPTELAHGYLAYALFTLAGVHALAALWHHFFLRDNVLQRMLPR